MPSELLLKKLQIINKSFYFKLVIKTAVTLLNLGIAEAGSVGFAEIFSLFL